MRYDAEQNALYDEETGALIPLTEGDEIPRELRSQIRKTHVSSKRKSKKNTYVQTIQNDDTTKESRNSRRVLDAQEQIQRDHDMALALSLSSEPESSISRPRDNNPPHVTLSSVPVFLPESTFSHEKCLEQEEADHAFALSLSREHDINPTSGKEETISISTGLKGEDNPYFFGGVGKEYPIESSDIELIEAGITSGGGGGGALGDHQMVSDGNSSWLDDLSLARALQAMEFEIASEMQGRTLTPEEEEFYRKENKASKCKRQLATASCFICIVQIALLIAMIQDDGYAPKSENPMYGPSAYTLVRYGAKVAVLIKYEHEWWRLITPVFLHAGIIHIVSNVAIQLRVGGYLELVFGRASWLFIYFSSGIYGNMLSCIFLPDSVGIGSSGAVLGMLTAWIFWILFRWSKVPQENRGQRNCQLLVVTGAVVLTLAFSFTDFVDWAAHFGGAIQGGIAAAMMLSREVASFYLRWGIRTVSAAAFVISYTWALLYMLEVMRPDKEYLELYDQNDDWGR